MASDSEAEKNTHVDLDGVIVSEMGNKWIG